MNILFIAIFSISLSVAAQFSLKAGMSSAGVKAVLAQPFGFHTVLTIFFDKFIFGGFLLYGVGAIVCTIHDVLLLPAGGPGLCIDCGGGLFDW